MTFSRIVADANIEEVETSNVKAQEEAGSGDITERVDKQGANEQKLYSVVIKSEMHCCVEVNAINAEEAESKALALELPVEGTCVRDEYWDHRFGETIDEAFTLHWDDLEVCNTVSKAELVRLEDRVYKKSIATAIESAFAYIGSNLGVSADGGDDE